MTFAALGGMSEARWQSVGGRHHQVPVRSVPQHRPRPSAYLRLPGGVVAALQGR